VTQPGLPLLNSITVLKAGDEFEGVPGILEFDTVTHSGSKLPGNSWPTGQQPSVEVTQGDPRVSFEEPLGHSVPSVGIEVAEGRLGHPVPEVRTLGVQHWVESVEQVSEAMMLVPSRQRPHLGHDGKQGLLRWVRVDAVLVCSLPPASLDAEPEEVESLARWHTRDFSMDRRSPSGAIT
jgi:hypothetical protein